MRERLSPDDRWRMVARAALIGIPGLCAGGLLFILFALKDEERVSSAFHLFPNVVTRSMILQGREMRSAQDTPEGRATRDRLLSEIRQAIEASDAPTIDCTLQIDISRNDFERSLDTFSILLGTWRLRFAIFFYGEVPDISSYLDPAQNAELLAPNGNISAESAFLRAILGADLRRDFRVFSPDGSAQTLSWRGERCENYSVIVIGTG